MLIANVACLASSVRKWCACIIKPRFVCKYSSLTSHLPLDSTKVYITKGSEANYVFTRQRRLRRFGPLTRETFTKGICCDLYASLPTLCGSGDASLKLNVSLMHDVLVWCYLRNMFDARWRMRFLNGFRAFWSIAAFLHSTDALIAFSLWRHWRFLRRTIFPHSSLNDILYFCGLIIFVALYHCGFVWP